MDHDDILELLSKGNREAAFEMLLYRYQNKTFRLVFSIIGNAAHAEEVTQDTFVKIWQALPGYDGRASLATWLYTIAKNTSLTHVRSERYRRTSPIEDGPEPHGKADRTVTRLEIDQMVARLPQEQREVVELFYLQDRAVEDVAAMLDLPEGTVKSHLFRARKALGAMMERKP